MLRRWKESRETWTYQKKLIPCAKCGRPVLPSLAITQGDQIFCAECVKSSSLYSELENLEPREGESMDDWMARWKKYREHCINNELEKTAATPRKKAVFHQ
ncbi:MAG: hypothetical protein LUO82_00880 [Methanomicrobiales archaeon]|nr:hypothetical protein [Methanomicrobiales archaeon]